MELACTNALGKNLYGVWKIRTLANCDLVFVGRRRDGIQSRGTSGLLPAGELRLLLQRWLC